MNKIKAIIITGFILIISLSCDPGYNNEELNNPENLINQGTISICVPLISSRITNFLNNLNQKNNNKSQLTNKLSNELSRAYTIANRVEFTLLDSGDNVIGTYTHYPQDNGIPAPGDEPDTGIDIIVDEGTGYSIDAGVFNTVVSSTIPVVTGSSAPFDVISGQVTDVTILCIPNNPETAIEDTVYSSTTVPTYLFIDEYYHTTEIVSTGGEKWYEITPTTEVTKIEGTPDSANYTYIILYNNDGSFNDAAFNSETYPYMPGAMAKLILTTTPGQTYFLGIMPVTLTNETISTVDIIYYPGPVDSDEENDDFSTAHVLDPNTPVAGLNLDDDYYMFTVDDQIGLDITIILTIINTPEYDMDLALYDSSETYIEDISLAPGESQAVYNRTLAAGGDYYISIETDSFYKGAEYTIIWNYE